MEMSSNAILKDAWFRIIALLFCVVVQTNPPLTADEFPGAATARQEKQFAIEFDVLTQPQPTYRIKAQNWGRVLQQLGLVVTFRDGRPGERTRIENVDRRGVPTTSIVGIMESSGQILIRDKYYAVSNPQPLVDLVEQVRRFGAAGPPEESPTWGLSAEQFAFVSQELSVPVTEPINVRTPVEAIESLNLPGVFRLQFSESAREQAFNVSDVSAVSLSKLTGVSKGTALAIVLAQYGLGFRPIAGEQPGAYTIEVHAGGETDNLWPVGWKTKEALISVMPELYKPIEFELEAVEVTGLITVITDRIKLNPFYSHFELQSAGINVDQLRYTRKADKLSPSRMFLLLGDKFKMGLDVRCDEAGQCFLWITTADEHRAFRRRFAHVIPGK